MNGPERLRQSGDARTRALVDSEIVVPPGIRERVRLAVDAKIRASARGRRRRWPWVALAGVVTSSAFAFDLAGLRSHLFVGAQQELRTKTLPREPKIISDTGPEPTVSPEPAVPSYAPTDSSQASPSPSSRSRERRVASNQERKRSPNGWVPAWPAGIDEEAPPLPDHGPNAVSVLTISHQGQAPLSVNITPERVFGSIRGTPISLRIGAQQISGSIGEHSISLWFRGRRLGEEVIEGRIGGHESAFVVRQTPAGYLLQGTLPGHRVRLETGDKIFSWIPGCDRPLRARSPGVFEGKCEDGLRVRVSLPSPLMAMPVAIRLTLLGLLLPEPDPVLRHREPGLFPPE